MLLARPTTALIARVALLSALLVPAGCAAAESDASSSGPGTPVESGSFAALQSDLRARVEAPDRSAPWYHVIDELLPNTLYALPDEAAVPLTDCVVSGTVLDVEPGEGGKPGKGDTWVATRFDDPTAWTRTLHVSLAIEHQIGPLGCDAPSGSSSTVRFGVAVGPDLSFDDADEGLRAMGTVVAFLTRSPVFDYDPELYGVVLDGGMIADVNETDGSLTLPFVGAERARALLATSPTLEELQAAGRRPESVIAIQYRGENAVR